MTVDDQTIANIAILGIGGLPILACLATIFIKRRQRDQTSRTPIEGKLLRAPGESLRREMQKFDDGIFDGFAKLFFLGFVCVVLFCLVVWVAAKLHMAIFGLVLYAVILFFITTAAVRRVSKAMDRQWNNALGYRGECYVGEELNKLMLEGCRVFHDVPGDGPWNVDHVVVSPNGVFVVETKTRRKGKAAPGKEDHKVEFDGRQLNFPFGYDTHGIEQARRNADWLSKLLSNALAETIKTLPVLTLPGWFVTARVSPLESGIAVVNPKGIPAVVRNNRIQGLTEKQIQQIAYQIEQRCRDVEF